MINVCRMTTGPITSRALPPRSDSDSSSDKKRSQKASTCSEAGPTSHADRHGSMQGLPIGRPAAVRGSGDPARDGPPLAENHHPNPLAWISVESLPEAFSDLNHPDACKASASESTELVPSGLRSTLSGGATPVTLRPKAASQRPRFDAAQGLPTDETAPQGGDYRGVHAITTGDDRSAAPRGRRAVAQKGRPQLELAQTVNTQKSPATETLERSVLEAQARDPYVTEQKWKPTKPSRGTGTTWSQDAESELLRLNGRIYVPTLMVKELLHSCHDNGTAGHVGTRKTLERLRKQWFWPNMAADVTNHVKNCDTCQRVKARRHKPYGVLASLPIPERPFAEISLDFVTGLPGSRHPFTNREHDAVLVVVDRFTKYAQYIPTSKTLTSSGFAELFVYHVFRQYGLPAGIVSDRDKLFTSHFWKSLCRLLDMKRRLSTAYHPQTDGQTERQNQSLETYLRAYCNWHQSDWASLLTLAEWTYNNTHHTATRETPAKLLLGYQPRGPNDPTEQTTVPAANNRVDAMNEMRTRAKTLLVSSSRSYAKWYDRKRSDTEFKVGDWVLLSTKNLPQRRPSRKLADKYIGPYRISRVMDSKMACELELPSHMKQHNVFSISSLEPYQGEGDPQETDRRDEVDEMDVTYEVEAILRHKETPDGMEFLIRWKGYGDEDDSWEPRENLNEGDMLKSYLASI